jgi:hypothetical protein
MNPVAFPGPCGRKAARAFFFLLAAGCATAREGDPALEPDGTVSVLLAEREVEAARGMPAEERQGLLTVHVAGRPESPLFGDCRIEGRRLVFSPRYPFRPGLSYTARFHQSRLGGQVGGLEWAVEETFAIPAPPPGPPARVVRVTPTGDVLPENQLKFYLYFSAPMSRGEAYSRVHLREAGGKEVGLPFLELGEELWDASGTRITLFFDPGRIKRELLPREQVGPSLEAGKAYELVIDREWPDAGGRPLEAGHRKAFRVVAPDERQPDPARWALSPPRAGSKDPLDVRFDEPLDHAMLGRVLKVLGPAGAAVPGRVEIDAGETRWRFHPEGPWAAGTHGLRVDALLEDLAGNSILKPFEVDVFRPIERKSVPKFVTLPFEAR